MADQYVQDSEWQPSLPRSGPMSARPRQEDEENEKTVQASTPHLDRLEKLASAAATAAQARQWRARKNGLQDQGEVSEVRNLPHGAAARAQAEVATQQMMAKSKGKQRCQGHSEPRWTFLLGSLRVHELKPHATLLTLCAALAAAAALAFSCRRSSASCCRRS
jgi:hypothetical protein